MRKFYPLLLFVYTSAFTQPTISYQPFLSGFSAPIEVVNAGDGSNRLFIVQQNGVVRVYDPANGGLQATPFLDISSQVTFGGERGLLSLAFHPSYQTNGYFFVYYNNLAGELTLSRVAVSSNANVANSGSLTVLLTIAKPFANHNGGHLQFGTDGHLYFATGDGGDANDPFNNAQDGSSLLGKMIRINVDNFATPPYYTVPVSNPFVGNAAVDDRIWAVGLRNPFRWSFDRLTGDMWIGDVGQGVKEEVNFRPASSTGGENYGWRCYEGSIRNPNIAPCDPPSHTPPIFDYDNPNPGAASVVGGYVYRGAEYPFFQGWYLTTDAFTNAIYLIRPNGSGGWTVNQQTGNVNFIVSFGEAENGTLYAVSQSTNQVYKVVATDVTLPLVLQRFSAGLVSGGTALQWTTATEDAGATFIVMYSTDSRHFIKAGEVKAAGNTGGASYSYTHPVTAAVPLFYRLQMVSADGSSRYSNIVKVAGRQANILVYPTLVRDGTFFISGSGISRVQVVSSNGRLVLDGHFVPTANPAQVQLPPLAGGIYVVRVYNGLQTSYHKIVVK